MTKMADGLGFLIGFQRDGSQAETQGDGEDNGE
jgi:hypothetical protein